MLDFVLNTAQEILNVEVNAENDLFLFGLDSLGVLKMISYIEDEYNIEIEDEDLTMENLRTATAICEMIKRYQ